MIELVHYSAVMSICYSVFCRARRMDENTCARLKLQNGLLLVLSLLSLPIFGLGAGDAIQGLAICLYLGIDAPRWRNGPPV